MRKKRGLNEHTMRKTWFKCTYNEIQRGLNAHTMRKNVG